MLEALTARGMRRSTVSLHVSAGTFRPVTAAAAADHAMHEERFSVRVAEVEWLAESAASGRPIIPVGTTSVRVLESLYWIACRAKATGGPLPPTRGALTEIVTTNLIH